MCRAVEVREAVRGGEAEGVALPRRCGVGVGCAGVGVEKRGE